MKQRKYLNPPIWPYVLFTIVMIFSQLEGIQTSPTDRAISSAVFVVGLLGMILWAGRSLRRGLQVESQFRAGHILCPYCIYILDKNTWPQQCPECGVHHTREEVYNYWNAHVDVTTAFGDPDPDQS